MNFERGGQAGNGGMLIGTQPDFVDGAKYIPGFPGEFGRIARAKAEQGNSRHKELLIAKKKGLSIYPKIIVEPHFEWVRLCRTHSKCELLQNFRIGSKVKHNAQHVTASVTNRALWFALYRLI
jgi:hypothetical protein